MKKTKLLLRCIFGFFCVIFGVLAIDWGVFTLFSFLVHSSYRGAFFPEVWSFVSYLYLWLPEHTFTRFIVWFVVGIVTVFLPAFITILLWVWSSKFMKKLKWGILPHFFLIFFCKNLVLDFFLKIYWFLKLSS